MMAKVKPRDPASRSVSERDSAPARREAPAHSSAGAKIDEMGKGSFPASDPPAVWTWEPPKRARDRPAG
jgi:hypothetical protein